MASLPFDLSGSTSVTRQSGVIASMAVDGTQRYLDLGTVTWYRINCGVDALSATQRDTLIAFLDTNETSEIDVGINGTTYRGRLIPDAGVSWSFNRGLYNVTFAIQARPV